MYNITEQMMVANKVAVDSLLLIANAALASAERFAALNINTARVVIEDGVDNTKALLSTQGAQQVATLQSAATQPNVNLAVSYSRSLFEISAQTQDVFAKLMDAQVGDFQVQVAALIDKVAVHAPIGSELTIASVRSALASANLAFDRIKQGAKQVSALTESNVNAATAAVRHRSG